MKTWLIISSSILGVGLLGFFWMNSYENQNNCNIKIVDTIPFFECVTYDDLPWKVPVGLQKPLILLYPELDTHVQVKLEYAPGLSATFPQYDTSKQGWSVLAHPDGTLRDSRINQETYGLFWEGNGVDPSVFDLSKGFIVRGSDIREFLYGELTEIGLNTKEKSDFIMYWYPKLQGYPYVQVTFAGTDYTDIARLDISPKPDSILRVFMIAKPLTEYKKIPEQSFQKFERKGFSVVEWGGTILE